MGGPPRGPGGGVRGGVAPARAPSVVGSDGGRVPGVWVLPPEVPSDPAAEVRPPGSPPPAGEKGTRAPHRVPDPGQSLPQTHSPRPPDVVEEMTCHLPGVAVAAELERRRPGELPGRRPDPPLRARQDGRVRRPPARIVQPATVRPRGG